ncbi:DNA polymerase III subunit delta' [Halopseudomonas sp.]|uniref:DNA polymerase III subunit delta' n=1 Tax=Halopseudomonas sp. TaxID=2901191 RepID=UPI003564E324
MPEVAFPWHDTVWTQLTGQDQHAHAYLFSGLPGVGKRRFANAFAAFLLCTTPAQGMACGRCRSCLLREAGTHPDLLLITPEEEGKAIRVDAIRQLVDFMGQTSQQGGSKVIVLYPAEAMNQNAANALLKSLEEPTADTYLLLVTDQPGRLLPTIRSRCRGQRLPTPSRDAALSWLADAVPELNGDDRLILLQMAGGAPLRAQALHDLDAVKLRLGVVENVKALLKDQQSASQLADSWSKIPLELLIDWFCSWTLDLLKLQTGAIRHAENSDMDVVLGYMAKHVGAQQLMEWQDWLLAHRSMTLGKANLNRGLFLESLLLEWKQLLKKR